MLFYLIVSIRLRQLPTHVNGCINIFFYVYAQNILYFKKIYILYVLKTHFDCFNRPVNNLKDMEREQRFGRHKAEEIYESKLVSSKY